MTETDPIFPAIARHQRALDSIIAAPEQADALYPVEVTAFDDLVATVPTTVEGCRALLEHILASGGRSEQLPDWVVAVFSNVANALTDIAARR